MALADPYKRLLDLIDEWLAHKDKLVKLGYQTGRHSGDIPSDLTQVLEKENNEIAQLSTDIESAADQVIRSPLSLLEKHLSGPCDENLQYARQSIAEGEIVNDCEECEADDCEECERVRYLLELSESCVAADRVEYCLFLATELSRKGLGKQARAVTNHALKYLPSDDHQMRVVAYLSQGSFCTQVGTGKSLNQARQVYNEASKELSILYVQVNEGGYRKKARTFGALKDSVDRCLAQIKPIPFIPKAIRIVGEIAAGKAKIAPDDITGFIRQTDKREFQLKGQPLKAKPLGKSQITFAEEYSYIAIQVSGDSMNRADISPGDYVLLRRAKAATAGDIVAVVFRNEDDNRATLKRILIEPNKITLKPESSNPKHESRFLPPEAFVGDSPSVAIVGIAIAVLKPRPWKTS